MRITNFDEICVFNMQRPRQNGHYFAGVISIIFFYSIFMRNLFDFGSNFIEIWAEWLICNKPALVQVMGWHQLGSKFFYSKDCIVSWRKYTLFGLREFRKEYWLLSNTCIDIDVYSKTN